MYRLNITDKIIGRAVCLGPDGIAYIGQNYKIIGYDIAQRKKTTLAVVPCPLRRKAIEPSRLLCRLFRHEIRYFTLLPDRAGKILSTRQGVYYADVESINLIPAHISIPNTVPPGTMMVDTAGRVLWGEYWSNERKPRDIRLFVSEDHGRSYEPVLEFKARDILHIHSIVEDIYEDCYWLCTGDFGNECGIARVSKDFKCVDWVVRGEQRYRTVNVFIFKDKIVYATDTQLSSNGIYVLDKASGNIEKICDIPGSCIHSARFGKWYVISTSVEKFEKQFETNIVTLWVSPDALNWQKVYEVPKDFWPRRYFQFGSLVLPRTHWGQDKIVFSGQAVKTLDNRVCIAEIEEG